MINWVLQIIKSNKKVMVKNKNNKVMQRKLIKNGDKIYYNYVKYMYVNLVIFIYKLYLIILLMSNAFKSAAGNTLPKNDLG